MSDLLMKSLGSAKLGSRREYCLAFIFVAQSLIGMGWIAVYPLGGYVSLGLWGAAFLVFKFKPVNFLFYGLLIGLIAVFYLFPRTYGSGNTAWHLSLLVYTQLIFLDRKVFTLFFSIFVKFLLFVCIGSFIYRVITFYGVNIPFRSINLDPQFFHLYWPFYVERLNISGDGTSSLIGSFRFHGPFFEPGALGIALAVSLYGDLTKWKLSLIVFFGALSMSMAFFFIGFIRMLEYAILKSRYEL